MNIWITGASGMLGKDLVQVAVRAGHHVIATDREVDITKANQVSAWLAANAVDVLINCAAYTAVDLAETETDRAHSINVEGADILACETAHKKIPMIHVSTDYVLNGEPPHALTEEAPLQPINAYGRTKAEGEYRVRMGNPKHWIVRTAWLYGLHGKNFVKTMLKVMNEHESLRVVDDQHGSPTWTVDLALALVAIAEKGTHFGTYHYTNNGQVTWYGFACEIQRQALERQLLNRNAMIHAVDSSAYPTPAARPKWSVLDKTLIQKTFGVEVPHWKDSLADYLDLEKIFRA